MPNSFCRKLRPLLATCLLISCFSLTGVAADPVPAEPTPRWWKGNMHTHSLWSDGDDFPEMIAEWYRTQDYNFLVISDHNVLGLGQRWMKQTAIAKRGGQSALAKYQSRFGGSWVETRGEGEDLEVRLKPFDEFRYLLENRGQFILIPGEEVSDRAAGKPIHMNASNVGEVLKPMGGATPVEAMSNNLRAVEEQAKRLGREILMHLNHPNFGWAITAEEMAQVTSEQFFEVYNGHPGVNHLGDATRPSIEHMWDIANTMRLTVLEASPLLGLATDDSHDYHDGMLSRSISGRGWVMVRSEYLTPEHLIQALRRGDFFASSGVSLEEVTFDPESRTLTVQIDPEADATYTTQFIGTRIAPDADKTLMPAKEKIGIEFAKQEGNVATYTMQPGDLYVRATVTSSKGADRPSFKDQKKQAWTQPVGYETR
ncbi:hypothetical protein [Rosistilla oblonga]|uniref:hypothetical protein n=1 Tax=Rosistilla oblonga TaxID=2527990 RepID=UPI003A97DF93